jgi:ADP-ribose pyrophosphatase
MLKKWIRISTEEKFSNPFWTYKLDLCKIPNGKTYEYHYVHTAGSVFIVPVSVEGKILMVNQFRYLIDKFSLEFPGGGLKDGETPIDIARKELIEETGFDGTLKEIGYFVPYNGVSDEICYVFIATDLKPSTSETKDEQEEFELLLLTVEELEEKIIKNEISDGMTLASWMLARKYFHK